MKVNIEIDCTPDEARRFFGLPDVAPMQAEIMEIIQERMRTSVASMEPAELMAQWMPLGLKGMEQMQNMWAGFMAAANKPGSDKP